MYPVHIPFFTVYYLIIFFLRTFNNLLSQDGPLPKGAILVIKGLKGISNRESVRDSFEPYGIEKRQVAYIEYAREEGEAKLRLKETNAAVSLLQKLKAHEAESGKPFKIDDKEVNVGSHQRQLRGLQ
jgi:hypothetical protein